MIQMQIINQWKYR